MRPHRIADQLHGLRHQRPCAVPLVIQDQTGRNQHHGPLARQPGHAAHDVSRLHHHRSRFVLDISLNLACGSHRRVREGRPKLEQRGLQLCAIKGEIEHHLTRCGENGHAVGRLQGIEKLQRGVPRVNQVAEVSDVPRSVFHVQIVEQQRDEMFRNGHRRSLRLSRGHCIPAGQAPVSGYVPRRVLDREFRNFLRLAFVEDLKILFAQIPDGVSLGIAHHHRHQHQIRFGLELDHVLVLGRLRRGSWSKEEERNGERTRQIPTHTGIHKAAPVSIVLFRVRPRGRCSRLRGALKGAWQVRRRNR